MDFDNLVWLVFWSAVGVFSTIWFALDRVQERELKMVSFGFFPFNDDAIPPTDPSEDEEIRNQEDEMDFDYEEEESDDYYNGIDEESDD